MHKLTTTMRNALSPPSFLLLLLFFFSQVGCSGNFIGRVDQGAGTDDWVDDRDGGRVPIAQQLPLRPCNTGRPQQGLRHTPEKDVRRCLRALFRDARLRVCAAMLAKRF